MQTHRKRPDETWLSRSTLGRWFAVALVAAGCNAFGGQTGTEAEPDDTPRKNDDPDGSSTIGGEDAYGTQCERDPSVVDLDDAKALGFSAEDVISMAEGAHEAGLVWNDPSFDALGATGTFGPEQEDDTVTLTVTYRDGEVRLVRFAPKEQKDAGGDSTAIAVDPAACPSSRFEIDVGVKLETSGGAFDESFDAVLVSSEPLIATLDGQLRVDELDGSFEVELTDVPSDETITVGPVDVQASLYSGGMSGALSSFIETRTKEVAGQGMVQYAHWPADDPCTPSSFDPAGEGGFPVSFDAAFEGISIVDVLAELESISDIPVTWKDDSDTEASLALSARGGTACLVTPGTSTASDGAPVLRIPVDIALDTADGRVDTTLTGTLDVASAAESEPGTLKIAATLRCESEDRATECGWTDLDANGYDAVDMKLSLDAEQPAGASMVGGTLTLTGITTPDCRVDEPVLAPDDGSGAGTSGCAGEQRTEIENGAMGAP